MDARARSETREGPDSAAEPRVLRADARGLPRDTALGPGALPDLLLLRRGGADGPGRPPDGQRVSRRAGRAPADLLPQHRVLQPEHRRLSPGPAGEAPAALGLGRPRRAGRRDLHGHACGRPDSPRLSEAPLLLGRRARALGLSGLLSAYADRIRAHARDHGLRLVSVFLPAISRREASSSLRRGRLRRPDVLRIQHVPAGHRRDGPAPRRRRRPVPLEESANGAGRRGARPPPGPSVRPIRAGALPGGGGAPAQPRLLLDGSESHAAREADPLCPGVHARLRSAVLVPPGSRRRHWPSHDEGLHARPDGRAAVHRGAAPPSAPGGSARRANVRCSPPSWPLPPGRRSSGRESRAR